MRRLLWASLPRMLGVTRNPSRRFVLEKADTSFNTGNAEGFRVSPNNHPTKPGDFAWLRTSSRLSGSKIGKPFRMGARRATASKAPGERTRESGEGGPPKSRGTPSVE